DYIQTVPTGMKWLALHDVLEQAGPDAGVQEAIPLAEVAEPDVPRRAPRHVEQEGIHLSGAGAGRPRLPQAAAAAQRALETSADEVLIAKNGVDGVYDDDPHTNPDAVKLDTLTYQDALVRGLKVVDATAFSLCMDNALPMRVFGMEGDGSLARAIAGDPIGTIVTA